MFASTLPATFRCRHQGTAGSPARAGWQPAHPSPDPPAPVGPPQSRRAATPKPQPTPLAGNLFRRASRSGPTKSRSPSTAGADASRGSCSTQSCHSCRASANPCARSATPSCSTTLNAPAPSARFAEGRRATSPEPCPHDQSVGGTSGLQRHHRRKPRTPECQGRRDRHGLSPCLSGV
jgi:hypothetical protein